MTRCPDCPRLRFEPKDPRISVRAACCNDADGHTSGSRAIGIPADQVTIRLGSSMGKTDRMITGFGDTIELSDRMITDLRTPETGQRLGNRSARRRAEARARNPKK